MNTTNSNIEWNDYYFRLILGAMDSQKDALELGKFYDMRDWKNLIDFSKIYDKINEYKLIEKKNHFAMFHLGLANAMGLNCVKNELEANKYYNMSAEHGNIFGLNNLAYMYEQKKELDKAIEYYNKSAEKGYHVAINNLKSIIKEYPIFVSEKLIKINMLEEKVKEIDVLKDKIEKLQSIINDMIIYAPGNEGALDSEKHFHQLIDEHQQK